MMYDPELDKMARIAHRLGARMDMPYYPPAGGGGSTGGAVWAQPADFGWQTWNEPPWFCEAAADLQADATVCMPIKALTAGPVTEFIMALQTGRALGSATSAYVGLYTLGNADNVLTEAAGVGDLLCTSASLDTLTAFVGTGYVSIPIPSTPLTKNAWYMAVAQWNSTTVSGPSCMYNQYANQYGEPAKVPLGGTLGTSGGLPGALDFSAIEAKQGIYFIALA